MTVSIEKVLELASKVGLDLTGCMTRSEMKRVVLYFYDKKHRSEYAAGRRMMITRADYNLLEALDISSFRSLFTETYTSP
jgi:hypothetical protein